MKHLSLFVAVALALPASADPGSAGHQEVVKKVSPAIVALKCTSKPKGGQAMSWYGTGVIVSEDGAILTSTTVVPADAQNVEALMPGGHRMKATMVAANPGLEIAMVRLPAGKYAHVDLGDSGKLKLGYVVYTFGNCLNSIENDGQVSVATGEVSGFYKIRDTFEGKPWYDWQTYRGEVIETTAALNPGVDGGPLIDVNGDVVGVMSLSYNESRYLGVAIPVDLLKKQIGLWESGDVTVLAPPPLPKLPGEEVEPPAEADGEAKGYLGATFADDFSVTSVDKNSPAARAGMKKGDVLKMVPKPKLQVVTGAKFKALLAKLHPGDKLQLVVERDGQLVTLEITLGYEPM